jgi:hypothetical protein
VNALNQNNSVLKNDAFRITLFVILMYVFLQIWYVHQDFVTVGQLVINHLWLFILPGFMLMYAFDIPFMSRLLIGIALGYSVSILFNIYLNLMFHQSMSVLYLIPSVGMYLTSMIIYIRRKLCQTKINQ